MLHRLIPNAQEVPSGFEIIGHIAHLNLKSDMLPYKRIIGQVILDVSLLVVVIFRFCHIWLLLRIIRTSSHVQKNPVIKTVVNKVDSIETVYRTFKMEVIAGEDNFVATMVCIFLLFLPSFLHFFLDIYQYHTRQFH